MKAEFSRSVSLAVMGFSVVCQTALLGSDCSTLKYARHKVSCLCGVVQICSGDICSSNPSTYELDDDVAVELRTKDGALLESQKAEFETISNQGSTQDGTAISFDRKVRSFAFKDRQNGDYLLAFILRKNGIVQPAIVFPTRYRQQRNSVNNSVYMVEPTCPK